MREQTAVEVLEIENDADAVAKKATASASKIKENAVTEADEKVEVARLQGLKLCGNQNFTARSSRRPPRHRRDACSMAWRCRFITTDGASTGRLIAEK